LNNLLHSSQGISDHAITVGFHAEQIGDPTLADGILGPLVRNAAHRIEMRGDSMRKSRAKLEGNVLG